MSNSGQNLRAMELVLAEYESTTGGDLETMKELIAADCVLEDWGLPQPLIGRSDVIDGFLAAYRASFPDGSHVLDDVITDGRRLMIGGTFTGVFAGDWGEVRATGESVTWAVRDIWEFEAGRAVRIKIGSDTETASRALGA